MKTLQDYIDKLNRLNFKEMYNGDFFLTWEKTDDEIEAVFTLADALRYMRENNISTKVFESGLGPAMILASVVFPTPGGPQNIMEDIWSRSISCLNILPFPRRCSWPTKSSKEEGLNRLASGALACRSSNKDICSILIPPALANSMSC